MVAMFRWSLLPVLGLLLGLGGEAFALGTDAMQSMVIIEGDKSRGSGFIVKMEGRTYLVTNSHVLRGNTKVTFKTLSNQYLTTGALQIADNADLIRAEVIKPIAALEAGSKLEQRLKIGDEIVVAGNAEGEGVVREIPGKIVGIGPDRVEVDAAFVPGNSGSPILLRSTGEVVGVATYMKIPRFLRNRSGSETLSPTQITTSLNEVRRFGFRVDTVTKWVNVSPPNKIMIEGLQLAQFEESMYLTAWLTEIGPVALAKLDSTALINKEKRAKSASLTALASAVDEYGALYRAAKDDDGKKQSFIKFLDKLKVLSLADTRGFSEQNFSGYFATQFKDHVERTKELAEFIEGMSAVIAKNSWDIAASAGRQNAQPIDITKVNLNLTAKVISSAAPDKRHCVSYPVEMKPANLDGIYWITEAENRKRNVVKLHQNELSVSTPANGLYRVYVEYNSGGTTRRLSNVVEIKVTDVGNSAAAIDSYTSKEESAPVIGPGEQPSLPDWKALAASLAKSEYQETNIAGHDSNASPIRDLPQSGGVLIGFECIIGPFKDSQETVRGVKPIFLTEGGQKEGTIWGSKKSASVLRVIAKPGFAVGRVTGQYDGVAIRRMKVRFDRLFGMKLNSADSYETDWIGSYENQTEASADTNGRLAIGLAGMCGLGVDGIRLICLKP